MFETLVSKTFFILSISLIFCYLGAKSVIIFFKSAYEKSKDYVSSQINENGQQDLVVSPDVLIKAFWPSLIINIVFFILLMIFRHTMIVNFIMMLLFVFTDGITLGLVLISIDENIGIQVAKLTGIATFTAALVGMFSGIDFAFMQQFLFWALLIFVGISFVRIFTQIHGFHRKVIAFVGILIFIGYMLYDFNNLSKAKNLAKLNNWNTALDFSIDIYLDIINLFLQILDLLSDS